MKSTQVLSPYIPKPIVYVEIVPEDVGDNDRKDVVFHLNLLCSKCCFGTFGNEKDAIQYAKDNGYKMADYT